MGMTFSGGIFDFILFGVIPDATQMHANSYWVIVIGAVFAPIYYFVFYGYIKHFDIKTPGRDDSEGDEIKMVSKAEYRASKASNKGKDSSTNSNNKKSKKSAEREERVLLLEKNLGGLDNLKTINACITRLRLTVVDRSKVNDEGLKKMGAMGIVGKDVESIQVIFGAEADIFKTELKKLRKERQE